MSDKWTVPFGQIHIGKKAEALIAGAIRRNWITQGPLVEEFEEKFARRFGWQYAVAVSSGTAAGTVAWAAVREMRRLDHVALVDVDEPESRGWVITPACAFAATANCLMAAGLSPIFADVELDTLNLAPDSLKDILIRKGESLGGQHVGTQFVANMGSLRGLYHALAGSSVPVIADLCEAHGAELPDPIQERVMAGLYSFYAAHLICAGEGGMICTDNYAFASLCRSIRNHGTPFNYKHFSFERFGINGRMTDLHAAVGLEQLETFDERFSQRRTVRKKLLEVLSPFEDRLILYPEHDRQIIAPHAFPVLLRNEMEPIGLLYEHLESAGIECKTLFGSIPTQHYGFRGSGYAEGAFPVSERIGNTALHFGCGEWITDEHVEYIYSAFKSYLERSA